MKTETAIIINEFAKDGGYKGALQGVVGTCEKIVTNAKALCPVDKAQLRNSLMYRVKTEKGGFNDGSGERAPTDQELDPVTEELTGYAGTNSDHWYPEFGTRTQVAQPYLRPAGELVKGGDAREIVIKYNQEAMKEEFKRKKVKKRGL